jgi:4-alpha-glucanotransferase
MSVLQFAWGGDAQNGYLPHNTGPNTVIYPGTHDNDTTLGWYQSAPEAERNHVRRYLRVSGEDVPWDFIRTAYASVARLAVVSLPDMLALGSAARFNTPASARATGSGATAPRRSKNFPPPRIYLRELANFSAADGAAEKMVPEKFFPDFFA